MKIKQNIPNFVTSLNLFCGCLGVYFSFNEMLPMASVMIVLAAIFDFLDGLTARALNVSSEIGKQLDSLADVISFGLLPGMIIFHMISIGFKEYHVPFEHREYFWMACIGFLIPVLSAVRLAKFNIDTRQTDSFIGLPTPANAMFFAAFPLILGVQYKMNMYYPMGGETLMAFGKLYWLYKVDIRIIEFLFNPYFYVVCSLLFSYLLVAELPLISLKFKSFRFNENKTRYIFLIICFLLIAVATIPYGIYIKGMPKFGFLALPSIIIVYIIYSVITNKKSSSN